jgi:hypothetical protein
MSKSGKAPSILKLTVARSPGRHIVVELTGARAQRHEQNCDGEQWGHCEESVTTYHWGYIYEQKKSKFVSSCPLPALRMCPEHSSMAQGAAIVAPVSVYVRNGDQSTSRTG